MPYIKYQLQVYDNKRKRYYLIGTSKEEWQLLGESYKRYKRVKLIFPKGVDINDIPKAYNEIINASKHPAPKSKYDGYEGRAYLIELEPISGDIIE